MMMIWLVVSKIFIFHNIWDVILPIDELIFFKMVKTTNQISTICPLYVHYIIIYISIIMIIKDISYDNHKFPINDLGMMILL